MTAEKIKGQDAFTFQLTEEEKVGRLDVVISRLLTEEVSRSFLQKLIESGNVTVNGVCCLSKKLPVQIGDWIEVTLPPAKVLDVVPEKIPLSVVYEDEDVLVVDKPKGMVVHPAPGNPRGTLVNAILYHCDTLSSINGIIRPGIVHRIDKDTSGLLMVAKNDLAHRSLAAQLAAHSITRAYEAIVWHNLKEEEGTVDAPLGRDPKNRLRMAVVREGGRRAVTHYRVLKRFGRFTYIEAKLETGRTHQIRVHMAYINHPLLGDNVYGPKKSYPGVHTQTLHARKLGFVHPSTGEYMEFESQLPQEFQSVLAKLEADITEGGKKS